jgi:hypothetical protein
MEFHPHEIYRVRSDEDPTALIAMDVKVLDGHLTWFDSSRDRGHRLEGEHEQEGARVFETQTGFRYRFEPLTKELYDREVRQMVELSPEFESTEALRRFYLKKFLDIEVEETDR